MSNLENWKPGDPIGYIRREIPEFEVPAYEGQRYEVLVSDTLDLQVNGAVREVSWEGRYAGVCDVKPGDVAAMHFPIAERTEPVWIEKEKYRLVRKGNEVVVMDPPGRYCPLYQRAHYRENGTRWRKIERFVSEEQIHW